MTIPAKLLGLFCWSIICLQLGLTQLPAAQSESGEEDATLATLRRLEEQQRELLRNLDSIRHDSAADLRKNSETIAERLREIETSISDQRQREWQAQQSFNRTFLVCLAVLGGLGVLGLGFLGFVMLRTVRRVGEVVTSVALSNRHSQLLDFDSASVQTSMPEASRRFLESVAQLDARLRQMEQASLPHAPE